MTTTNIEWCEHVWNPVVGCSVVSPGCTNCYAMKMAGRLEAMASQADGSGNHGLSHYVGTTQSSRAGFVWTGKVNAAPESTLLAPIRRRKPTRYFVNSMADLFHDAVPDDVIDRVFAVMALCPQHTFMVLTKRSARMREYLSRPAVEVRIGLEALGLTMLAHTVNRKSTVGLGVTLKGSDINPGALKTWPLPNVWLGVSVEDQTRADERRDDLRATPAAVKFVSYEPALGPVDWDGWDFVDQIIGGGESGPKARPAHPEWFRETRDFCIDYEIAYFHKQNGEFAPGEIAGDYLNPERRAKGYSYFNGRWDECWSEPDGHCDDEPDVYRVGKKRAGRLLDGRTYDKFPA